VRASDENLTTTLTVMAIMPSPPASATLQCCYAGPDRAAAARALDPFRQLTAVASEDIRAMPYANALEDAHHPAGVRIEARNTLVPDLGAELIAAVEELLGGGGAVLTLRSLGGAFSRVPPDATAFAHRDAEAMLVAGMLLPADPAPGQVEEAQARWAAVAIHGSGAYVNFAGSATEADLAAIYPPATRQRLAAVKRAYDPAMSSAATTTSAQVTGECAAGTAPGRERPQTRQHAAFLIASMDWRSSGESLGTRGIRRRRRPHRRAASVRRRRRHRRRPGPGPGRPGG
jgi:hypothetical protein